MQETPGTPARRDSLSRISRPLVEMIAGPPRRSVISSQVRSGMRISIQESSLSSVYAVFTTGAYLTGFALLLGLGDAHLALLGAMPMVANIPGLIGAWMAARLSSHKRVVVPLAALGAYLWIPMVALPFVPVSPLARVWLFLGLYFLSSMLQGTAQIVWQGWMSELVPERLRGRFWGRRNQVLHISQICAMLGAGVLLDAFRDGGAELYGYIALVAIALAFRTASLRGLQRQHEPAYAQPDHPRMLRNLGKPLRDPVFRPLLVALGFFQFSIGLIGAFVGVYMLKSLQLSFTVISALTIMHLVVGIFASRYWGVVMDRSGVRPVIVATCFLTGLVPFLWIASLTIGMPAVILLWVLSGVGWVGFNLAAQTLPFALSPQKGRTYYLAVLNIVTGVVFFLGSMIGGTVAEIFGDFRYQIGPFQIIHYHILFFFSGLGRFVSIGLFLRVRETRSRPMMHAAVYEGAMLWSQFITVTHWGQLAFRRLQRKRN